MKHLVERRGGVEAQSEHVDPEADGGVVDRAIFRDARTGWPWTTRRRHREQEAIAADTPEVARRKEAAALHRERVRDLLRSIHSDQGPTAFVIVDEGPRGAAGVRHLGRRDRGGRWIWNAALPDDEFSIGGVVTPSCWCTTAPATSR